MQTTVYQGKTVQVDVPQNVLGSGSLQLSATEEKVSFQDWNEHENEESFHLLQGISSIWHEKKKVGQFLVYGKESVPSTKPFNWEIIPYQKTHWFIGRFWQQFKVLWRITFGATSQSASLQQKDVTLFQKELPEEMGSLVDQVLKVEEIAKGNDAFCKKEVIEKQRVLEGKRVNVLYNYAPIGFGGERLHFLIVPKNHSKSFKELTKEEYLEASKLTQLVLKHFKDTRDVKGAYLFHKTGEDAGQTVDHWHIHLIITTNATQDLMGKITVLRNMMFGSSPLRGAALTTQVEKYKKELNQG